MIKFIFIFWLLSPLECLAQFTLSGKVVADGLKNSVANVSVFLNNAVAGTKTNQNGTFTINNVKAGQYDLVVSIIGFETFHKPIIINQNSDLGVIVIIPKAILLDEVKIKPHGNRERVFQTFKRLFLGTSENATDCKILNPDVLNLDFDRVKMIFTASSTDFIEIENSALGYKVRYMLSTLVNDNKTNTTYFEGTASFEELKGNRSQQRKWQSKRLSTFNGSSMDFFRTMISKNINKANFKIYRLIRKPNSKFPEESGDRYIQSLVNMPLQTANFIKSTDIEGEFAFGFDDCLYITYQKKAKIGEYANLTADRKASIITFDSPYAFFDLNGIVINPRS